MVSSCSSFLQLVFVLAGCWAAANARNFVFKWDNNWMNPQNWEHGLPSVNSSVRFPASISNFGDRGGVVQFAGSTAAPLTADVSNLYLQRNMRLDFPNKSRLNLHAQGPNKLANVTINSFVERTSKQLDFGCFANWNSTGSITYLPPCYNDTAIFPSGNYYMVNIPSSRFLRNLVYENEVFDYSHSLFRNGSSIYEFDGDVQFQPEKCAEKPLINGSIAYCQPICTNTCPELIPDRATQLKQILEQTNVYLNLTTKDEVAANDVVDGQIVLNTYLGKMEWDFGFGPTGVYAEVFPLVILQLAMSVKAVAVSVVHSIDFLGECRVFSSTKLRCLNVVFTMEEAKAESFGIYPSSTSFPALADYFFPTLLELFNQSYAQVTVDAFNDVNVYDFTVVRFLVPSPFVDNSNLLGSTLALTQMKDAMIIRLASPFKIGDVLYLDVLPINSSAYAFTALFVKRPLSPASSAIASSIVSSSPIIFSLDHDQSKFTPNIPLFTPPAKATPLPAPIGFSSLYVVNQVLFNLLPVTDAAVRGAMVASLFDYICSRSALSREDFYAATFTRVSGIGGRRAIREEARASTIPIVRIDICGTTTVEILTADLIEGWVYGTSLETIVVSDPSIISPDLYFGEILSTESDNAHARLISSRAYFSTFVNETLNQGGPADQTAVAYYVFSDLDFSNDLDGNKPYDYLTIEKALIYLNEIGSDWNTFAKATTKLMATYLPASASQMSLSNNLLYVVVDPRQAFNYSLAYYTINVKISAPAFLFNLNAYGDYLITVPTDTSAMKTSEESSPLSRLAVKDALEKALWLKTIEANKAYLARRASSINAELTTSSSSSTPVTSNSVFLVAIAAGVVILILVLIFVYKYRQAKRNPSRKPSSSYLTSTVDRKVIAFENPDYKDDVPESFYDNGMEIDEEERAEREKKIVEGYALSLGLLADHGAKVRQQRKESVIHNPIYESTLTLNDFPVEGEEAKPTPNLTLIDFKREVAEGRQNAQFTTPVKVQETRLDMGENFQNPVFDPEYKPDGGYILNTPASTPAPTLDTDKLRKPSYFPVGGDGEDEADDPSVAKQSEGYLLEEPDEMQTTLLPKRSSATSSSSLTNAARKVSDFLSSGPNKQDYQPTGYLDVDDTVED